MVKLYHLSHIDLDGYGCQYLTSKKFDNALYYNANYGPEVKARLEQIMTQIEVDASDEDSLEPFILITDLNLTPKESKQIEQGAIRLNAKLLLLDHHGSGEASALKHDWYNLDTSRCATLITYEWLQKEHGFDSSCDYKSIVQAINAVDIWLDDDKLFEYGKVMLGMISGAREINRVMFPVNDLAYRSTLIEKARWLLSQPEAHIRLDDSIYPNKKEFFKLNNNDTKDNLVAAYISKLMSKNIDAIKINYLDYTGVLGYNVGNTSIMGNMFLVNNPEIDFYMDVNYRGGFSLRSNNKLDVSAMAAKIGNGGGHPNASGGKIKDYKDSFVYDNIRSFVQNYINEKSMA